VHYPSREWGEGTRGFVCLVANPNDHAGPDGLCSRYGGIPCSAHRDALTWVLERVGPDLISPQHLVVEPDGIVAWRREYFSGDLGPSDFEELLARTSPPAAIRRAAFARRDRIEALERAPIAEASRLANEWLGSGDALAASGIAALLAWSEDASRRLALIEALAEAGPRQAPVLLEAASSALLAPDEAPVETEAWLTMLARVDAAAGGRAALRVVVRTGDAALRRVATGLAPESDRAEALLLAGCPDEAEPFLAAATTDPRRMARAKRRAGLAARGFPALADALRGGTPGERRGALLEADAEEVRGNEAAVRESFRVAPEERVRLAAALALLSAGTGADIGVAEAIAEVLDDPVEGEETREEAVRRLGTDPGGDPAAWVAAIRAATGGAR
jgi:hypothetical protein